MQSYSSSLQDLSDSRSGRRRETYQLAVSFRSYPFRMNGNRAGSRFYLLLLSSHAAAITPGLLIGAISHYFPISFGLRPSRRGSACSLLSGRFIPVHPTLPAMFVGGDLSRELQHSLYVTALRPTP